MLCKICNTRNADYRGVCKVCDYKRRHCDDIQKVIDEKYWTEGEIDLILDMILHRKIEVINDLLPYLDKKTLKDLVDLLSNSMRIGNAPQHVRMYCFICNQPVVRTLKQFYNERVYCSYECRDKYKTQYMSKENSPFYKREHTVCTHCKKPIEIIPFDYKKINSFGDSNHFCSQECYWEYRSKYYIGERCPQYGVKMSEELKKNLRESMLNNIKNGIIPQTMTSPHKKIYQLLVDHGIECENEYLCKYHSIDIYVEQYNLMIEIMGDYWHGNPFKYSYDNLNKQQLKDIKQDKSKHTYVKRYCNNEILYLWESDINSSIDLCWSLILLFINKNGILDNYHSFNYYMDDNIIQLSDNIVSPYFDNTESLSTAG